MTSAALSSAGHTSSLHLALSKEDVAGPGIVLKLVLESRGGVGSETKMATFTSQQGDPNQSSKNSQQDRCNKKKKVVEQEMRIFTRYPQKYDTV